MDLERISMAKADALAAFREYRAAVKARHTAEDAALMRGYKALARGLQVIDLHDVMRGAGLDEQGRPRLAIVRADADAVLFVPSRSRFEIAGQDARSRVHDYQRRCYVEVPAAVWPSLDRTRRSSRAIVPPVPPRFRPSGSLSRYHILWEAEWQDVPTDPLLLRHLGGALYAVLAQWDLTALERAVLRGRLGR